MIFLAQPEIASIQTKHWFPFFFFSVVPGSKRDKTDYHTVEQEAGRAVLKLLDAKIGRYKFIWIKLFVCMRYQTMRAYWSGRLSGLWNSKYTICGFIEITAAVIGWKQSCCSYPPPPPLPPCYINDTIAWLHKYLDCLMWQTRNILLSTFVESRCWHCLHHHHHPLFDTVSTSRNKKLRSGSAPIKLS